MTSDRIGTCSIGDRDCPLCGAKLGEMGKLLWCVAHHAGDGHRCMYGVVDRVTIAEHDAATADTASKGDA